MLCERQSMLHDFVSIITCLRWSGGYMQHSVIATYRFLLIIRIGDFPMLDVYGLV
jgi:hypothetical protein